MVELEVVVATRLEGGEVEGPSLATLLALWVQGVLARVKFLTLFWVGEHLFSRGVVDEPFLRLLIK